jgi:hypothetical protein
MALSEGSEMDGGVGAANGSSFDTSGGSFGSTQTQLLQSIDQLEQMLRAMLADIKQGSSNAPPTGSLGGSGGGGFDPSMFAATGPGPTSPPASAGAPTSTGTGLSSSSVPVSSDFGGSTLGPGFPPQLEPYRSDIESASQQTGVPANLLAAQIWQESRGNPGAASTNSNGMTDAGLMQVDPATFASLQQEHPALQGKNLSDPSSNILAGAYYMSDMSKQFGGNWDEALRAYNSGPDQVNAGNLSDVSIGDPNYVNEVTQFASTIQQGGQLPA